MASPDPTGRLLSTEEGSALAFTRTLPGSQASIWAALTEPELTARWVGPWRGEAGPGRTVEVRMTSEEGAPWSQLRIEACEPPRRLAVVIRDDAGGWPLELRLSEADGHTTVELVHRLTGNPGEAGIGEIGPGWEFYLDRFVAARQGAALPSFGSYYPAQKAYFDSLAEQGGTDTHH
ncbi:SRPBCC family protein [Streptomyces albipurpureus]|uniref:SRPBCC family protein n=1 Tax=Streptomyces albipurpureus TaxID=2897419 RepID=A0ABT0UR04_9ACTN|nr:SRPBCC family protein [Streptomyces sp. CWNU-1]MCM2390681.1 SRPBCC family protein [Streptomyces sp. CWNU-1]